MKWVADGNLPLGCNVTAPASVACRRRPGHRVKAVKLHRFAIRKGGTRAKPGCELCPKMRELRFFQKGPALLQSSPQPLWPATRFGRKEMTDKPSTTKAGTVQKIIKSPDPSEPEKAEIAVQGADDLYKEIRIENTLTDEKGNEVQLKVGARVEVTVEAPPEATIPKKDNKLEEKSQSQR
jgi:hypothetical protein